MRTHRMHATHPAVRMTNREVFYRWGYLGNRQFWYWRELGDWRNEHGPFASEAEALADAREDA